VPEIKFEARETEELVAYLKAHPEITHVLVTGGDPLIMKTKLLRRYLAPRGDPHGQGSEGAATDPWDGRRGPDASPPHPSRERRRRRVGRALAGRGQAGLVPYYMFVERDTGAKRYFAVSLARGLQIFQDAFRHLSGLGRTVRGPSMSAHPGKARVLGTAEPAGEKVFVLDFLQARNPEWVGRPFFAHFDPEATWLDDLQPAFGQERFFFQEEQVPARPSATGALPVVQA
jgi:hypothetical protein